MASSLPLLLDMVHEDPVAHKDLVSSFVSILKQITEHRLPRDYDYHRIPAPWVQLHLLRILAVLGCGDQASSEQMYEVIVDVMRRADTGINVGYAIGSYLFFVVVVVISVCVLCSVRSGQDHHHHLPEPAAPGRRGHLHQPLHPLRLTQPQVHWYQGIGRHRPRPSQVRRGPPDGRHRLLGRPRRNPQTQDGASPPPPCSPRSLPHSWTYCSE